MIARSLAFAFALAAGVALAAESPNDYAYRLQLTATGDGAFFSVDLPAQVYEGVTRGDVGDLRVFNAHGEPVAHAFAPRPATTREAAGSASLPMYPLRVDDARKDLAGVAINVRRDSLGTSVVLSTRDGEPVAAERLIGYLVDASAVKQPIVALTLPFASASNVTTRVRVEASDDLATWRTLVAGAPLVDLVFSGRRLVHDRVEMPPTVAKYVRLTWLAGQPAPELAAITAYYGERIAEPEREWRAIPGTPIAGKAGEFEFDLGGLFPVDRVTLALPEVNTVAPAQLFARATPSDEWRAVTSAVFYRLREAGGEVASPPVAVAQPPRRYWLVRIDEKSGGAGAQAPRLSAGWQPHRVVFAARGKGPFVLAYGSARARPSALPIDTLVPDYERKAKSGLEFAVAKAGTPSLAAGADALRTPADVKRWALWAALVLASIVLAWMALRLSRQMGSGSQSRDGD